MIWKLIHLKSNIVQLWQYRSNIPLCSETARYALTCASDLDLSFFQMAELEIIALYNTQNNTLKTLGKVPGCCLPAFSLLWC